MKSIFITGATGFVGSHFVNMLSKKYNGYRKFLLVRDVDINSAKNKLFNKLESANSSFSNTQSNNVGNTNIMLGNILHSFCGISWKNIHTLRRLQTEELWHFASSLNFEDDRKEHIRSHNVNGVKNAVQLAKTIGIKRFIYVSTAYTCGGSKGSIPEELHQNVQFNNYYEETKNEAEWLIAQACKSYGINYTILRPSIVIGPLTTKGTGGSNSGLYGFLRNISRERNRINRYPGSCRVFGDEESGINLIPVDCLMQDICYLIDNDFKGGNIFHLSVDQMPTIGDCSDAIREYLKVPGFSIKKFDINTSNALEKKIKSITKFYSDYLYTRKTFQRSIPNLWTVTSSDLRDYVEQYVIENEGQKKPTLHEKSKRKIVLV